jgi:hypothetical protein
VGVGVKVGVEIGIRVGVGVIVGVLVGGSMGVEVGRAIWQEGFSAVGRASPSFFSVKVPVVESQHQA